jgi:hypothetical protein
MFGLFELELACLWMNVGQETDVLNMRPTRQDLYQVHQRVNHRLNGNWEVDFRRVRAKVIRVRKYQAQTIPD